MYNTYTSHIKIENVKIFVRALSEQIIETE